MHLYNFFVCGPKFTRFLLSNVGRVVVDQLRVRFLTCRPVPEIFAIKVESCQKTRRILDVFFSPSQILGGQPSKSYTHFITSTLRHVEWKKFCEDTPISPEVLFAHTLDFKPDFKFSRLKFFWWTPVPLGVCASKPSLISSACKNLRAQHPVRAEILYAK